MDEWRVFVDVLMTDALSLDEAVDAEATSHTPYEEMRERWNKRKMQLLFLVDCAERFAQFQLQHGGTEEKKAAQDFLASGPEKPW